MTDKKPVPNMPQKGHKQKPNHPWSGKKWACTIIKEQKEQKKKAEEL